VLRIPHRCDQIYRFHKSILILAVVASVLGGYFTLHLPLRSDLDNLLPESFPSVQALNRMRQEVGGNERLRVVLETPDIAAAKRFAQDLAPRLVASPLIRYVDYKNDVAFYRKNALLFLEPAELDTLRDAIQNTIDAGKRRLNPFLVDDLFGDEQPESEGDELATWEAQYRDKEPKPYYTNPSSTVLVMEIFPYVRRLDPPFIRSLVAEVRQIVDSAGPARYDPGMKVYYGGSLKNRLDEYDVVKRDILGTAVYGVGGVVLLIALFFGSLVGTLLVSVCLALSITWTFGLTYLVIGELNTITGFLFVILWGLGIDYGIHTFVRYQESRRAGFSTKTAIDQMVCQTGTAVGTTAVTTAAGFLLLMLMDFKGFAHLGFIAGVGVLFAFVAMVVVLPALIIVTEEIGILRIKPAAPTANPPLRRRPLKYARPVLFLALAATALAGYWSTRVEFEYDFTNLRAVTKERQLISQKTEGVFTLSESPAIVLADSRQDVEEIVAAVREKIPTDTLTPTVASVRSIFSLVPDDQTQRLEKIRAIRRLVEDEAHGVLKGKDKERVDELESYLQVDTPFTWADFPPEDKRQFVNTKGEIGNFVFIYPSVALRDGRQAIAFRDDIGTITTRSGKVFHSASSTIISAEMLVLMVREGRWALVLAIIAVFLLIWLDFRSFKTSLLVLSPLAIGLLWTGGLMHLLGMKLNFFNIVVLPSLVGIGVDNGVHICHRYMEEGPGSLYFVLRRTGLALVMTTLTTMVGYSGLIAATHPGLNSIGRLAVIGIGATFVTAVLVMPALLQTLEKPAPEAAHSPEPPHPADGATG